jgi:2-polyprenyl-6-hydroxyphenyl methylase/3-demethylubiquinone-9 3-methyltransferase
MKQSLKFYDELDWWDPRHSLLQMAPCKFDYFQEKIGPLEGLKILDVGCGGGLIAEEFAKRGADVVGIDLSEQSLQKAREHAAANGLRIRYERGKAEELPVGDGLFDAVICADCLEHVDDLDAVIRRVSRALRIGGFFCYDTINRSLLSIIAVAWIGNIVLRREQRRLKVTNTGHTHDWRKFIKPKELAAVLARYGLVNVESCNLLSRIANKDGKTPRIAQGPKILYGGYAVKKW